MSVEPTLLAFTRRISSSSGGFYVYYLDPDTGATQASTFTSPRSDVYCVDVTWGADGDLYVVVYWTDATDGDYAYRDLYQFSVDDDGTNLTIVASSTVEGTRTATATQNWSICPALTPGKLLIQHPYQVVEDYYGNYFEYDVATGSSVDTGIADRWWVEVSGGTTAVITGYLQYLADQYFYWHSNEPDEALTKTPKMAIYSYAYGLVDTWDAIPVVYCTSWGNDAFIIARNIADLGATSTVYIWRNNSVITGDVFPTNNSVGNIMYTPDGFVAVDVGLYNTSTGFYGFDETSGTVDGSPFAAFDPYDGATFYGMYVATPTINAWSPRNGQGIGNGWFLGKTTAFSTNGTTAVCTVTPTDGQGAWYVISGEPYTHPPQSSLSPWAFRPTLPNLDFPSMDWVGPLLTPGQVSLIDRVTVPARDYLFELSGKDLDSHYDVESSAKVGTLYGSAQMGGAVAGRRDSDAQTTLRVWNLEVGEADEYTVTLPGGAQFQHYTPAGVNSYTTDGLVATWCAPGGNLRGEDDGNDRRFQ